MGNGQPLPYNTSRIALKVKGQALGVIKMKGTEALSCPFRFEVDALIDRFFDMSGCIKSFAQLTFTGIDGIQRTIAGIITNVQEGEPHKEGQLKCRFRLESNLRLLAMQTDHRVILGHTLPDIVRVICEHHGITSTNFDLSLSYPIRPYVVQVGETDLEFIQRLRCSYDENYIIEIEKQAIRYPVYTNLNGDVIQCHEFMCEDNMNIINKLQNKISSNEIKPGRYTKDKPSLLLQFSKLSQQKFRRYVTRIKSDRKNYYLKRNKYGYVKVT